MSLLDDIEDRGEVVNPRRARGKHPDGWEPGVEWDGSEGKLTVQTSGSPVWNDLLTEWGFDPVQFEVVEPVQFRTWDANMGGGDVKRFVYYRATIRRRVDGRVELDALLQEVRKWKRVAQKEQSFDSCAALVVPWADWQIGADDAGGPKATLGRFTDSIGQIQDRWRDLRKLGVPLGRLVVAGLGDLGESCFAEETEVITRTGIRTIKELAAEGSAVVKSDYGSWIEAPFRSYGVQRIWEVKMNRGQAKRTIRTTANHRWFKLAKPAANSGRVETVTSELVKGDMLVSNFGKHPFSLSPIGVMAGFVFGDGHRVSDDPQKGCSVMVHRGDWGMLPFFEGHPTSAPRAHGVSPNMATTDKSDLVQVSGLPAFFKAPPSLNESLPYLYGWAAGYFAADGCVSGSVSISSARLEHLELFAAVCARLGIGTNPIRTAMRRGVGSVPTALHQLSLVRQTVPIEFMVHPEKRAALERLNTKPNKRPGGDYTWQRNRNRHWLVDSVTPTDDWEEVYCAEVPGTGSFTLANDLLTGNCQGFYSQQAFRAVLNNRDQRVLVRRMVVQALKEWAPLAPEITVAFVGGNHGEERLNGQSYTDFGDNRDVAVLEDVGEILRESDRFSHVRTVVPNRDLCLTLDLYGTIVGLAHGHQIGKASGSSPALKAQAWWKDQMKSMRPVGDADLLLTGHFHHLIVQSVGPRTHIQCPALHGGSDWWDEIKGGGDRPGQLSLVVDGAGWDHLKFH